MRRTSCVLTPASVASKKLGQDLALCSILGRALSEFGDELPLIPLTVCISSPLRIGRRLPTDTDVLTALQTTSPGHYGQADFDFKCYGRLARRLLRPTSEAGQNEYGAERKSISAHSTKPPFLGRSQEGFLRELFF